uniref:CUB domain-containing protein n=1 Tax=Steinernema glaseri TaxID=37863 RepID=A0A1I7ZAJ9_9BILA
MQKSHVSALPIAVLLLLLPSASAFVDVVCKPGQNLSYPLEPNKPLRLRTQNYPSPYEPFEKSFFLTLTPPAGYNIVLLLEQFLLDPDDDMRICSSGSCKFPKYDETDHRRTSSFYETSGETIISVSRQKTSAKPSMPHTGFSIYVKTYRATDGFATDCTKSLQLNEKEPLDFVLSPNYPKAHIGELHCNYSVRSVRKVRVLVFQYDAQFSTDLKGAAGNNVTLKGHPTADQPLAYYFDGGVDITFSIPAHYTGYKPPEFFLVVEEYSSGHPSAHCLNVGSFNMSEHENVTIGTPAYGLEAYPSNLNCAWNFYGTPAGHRMTIDVQLETEHCCDILSVTGIDNFPYRFRGDELREFGFPEHDNLNLAFKSDGLGSAVGFKANVAYQNCQCDQNRRIVMNESSVVDIFSAGYENDLSYCPDLRCSWIVTFPEDYVLSLKAVDVDLRYPNRAEQNIVFVKDVFNRTMNSFSILPNATSTGSVTSGVAYISFAGDSSYFFYSFNDRARGFYLQLSLTKMDMTKRQIPIDLTFEQRSEDISLVDVVANKTYIWTVSAPPGVPVHFYTLWKLDPAVYLDIFDGPNEFYTPLDTRLYYNKNTVIGEVPSVESSKSAMTIRLYSQKNITRFKAIVSIGNFNQTGCPTAFVYAASSLHVYSRALVVSVNPPKDSVTCQFLVASSKNETGERDGLLLPFIGKNAGITIYKHVYTNDQFLLSSAPPYPHFVFDDYLTVAYGSNAQAQFYSFSTQVQNSQHTYNLKVDDTGLLFSPDFLDQCEGEEDASVKQQFILESNSLTMVNIEVLRPLGNGTVYVAARYDNHPLDDYTLTSSNYSHNVTYNATNIKITYRSTGGTGGMIMKYSAFRLSGGDKAAISLFSYNVYFTAVLTLVSFIVFV